MTLNRTATCWNKFLPRVTPFIMNACPNGLERRNRLDLLRSCGLALVLVLMSVSPVMAAPQGVINTLDYGDNLTSGGAWC